MKPAESLLKLSHIAIACPEIAALALKLEKLRFKVTERHQVTSEKVNVAMIPMQISTELRLELLEPLATDSPIAKFLEKRPNGGLHHLAFEVSNIDGWKAELESEGISILPPGIRQAARGRALFIHPKEMGGVLVELEELHRPTDQARKGRVDHE